MNPTKRLWWILGILFVASFLALGLIGGEIYRKAPPMPEQVVSEDGTLLYTLEELQTGRQVWQTTGGQQVGSVWGHGAYLAPDWTADWLRREAEALLNIWARNQHGMDYRELPSETQAGLRDRLKAEMRHNSYNPETGIITVSPERAEAIQYVHRHYRDLFGNAPELAELREMYAIPHNALPDEGRRELLPGFFFWSAWAATTNRPDSNITYTSNWPPEPLVGNSPTPGTAMWSMASIILLLAGIAALVWYYVATRHEDELPKPPENDPLLGKQPTPSMRATAKYFYTVVALFLAQMTLGAITAHYAVEGHGFFGFPLAEYLPYSVARTWHTQLAVFWIATAWLATGLYIGPLVSGREPKYQKLGVNILYAALVFVVVGSLAGEWLGVHQFFSLDANFWFGHQGWEYVDLGRFWQILLFIGLMLWLVLVGRALWPALKQPADNRALILILFLSTIAIGLFYAAGLMWGKHTHLSMVTYWRWWVVHLWVEGFFEVFATAVIALIFTRIGLIRAKLAVDATLFATIIFLFGGILGTLHHLYFAGTPTSVIAIGAMFSALEVVPLVLIGFEAYENLRLRKAAPWVQRYRWPILFFVAVAFWNLVGAGLLGFLINPPLSLYYVQALNTTAAHGHAALFGVYGMLGIGLMLFCLRGMTVDAAWRDHLLKPAFWLFNIGLAAMVFLSLLPAGIYQAWASITEGLWYARSPAIVQSDLMHFFVWLRVPGDVIFAAGVLVLAWFSFLLWKGSRTSQQPQRPVTAPAPRPSSEPAAATTVASTTHQ
ncbi:nitric oxide reductase large subunit [Alkalilimnicola ehrlichii]|uniref:Nitric oxide reductase large subunit n=1 Tax=Alkalilimnicola ehrlichii TaxID=351052 RepID=A0A3E0WUJ0_9GAMM|nr:nitric-oxide reductase large subunit [Alkalilimnicola ehrlichii]RFA29910.1 nitric oxide reductase large subunit [Alkalilimnicola ehrlichii]RFA36498.1 nitric oxide reductase large subunit [Alkalilimnicola ehrlichii]